MIRKLAVKAIQLLWEVPISRPLSLSSLTRHPYREQANEATLTTTSFQGITPRKWGQLKMARPLAIRSPGSKTPSPQRRSRKAKIAAWLRVSNTSHICKKKQRRLLLQDTAPMLKVFTITPLRQQPTLPNHLGGVLTLS